MKKSLRSKVLILSLAALVVAGSGCERRGRVPAKKEAAKENVVGTGDKQTTVEQKKNDGSTTTPIDTANEETQLLADAKMDDCKASIDVLQTSTIETFEADIKEMHKLRECLQGYGDKKGYGVKIIPETWEIDASPVRDLNDPTKNSTLLKEYDALTMAAGSNEEKAAKVLVSRLKVLELNSKKILDKYTEARLKPETEYGSKPNTVGATLAHFSLVVAACEKAAKLVEEYTAVEDGVDLTQAVAADEVSEE